MQLAHAAIEAARHGLIPPHIEHPHLVLLAVNTERELELAAYSLRQAGIQYRDFREPDLGNSMTALATAPLDDSQRKCFRKFQLLKGE